MFNHELYASALARAVDLMRQKDAKENQKAALRALVTLAASGSATFRCYDGELSVDDVSIDTQVPHTGSLAGRLGAHNIAEIAIGRGAEPAELFALVKALSEGPYGVPQVKERLRDAKSQRIWVLLSNGGEETTPKRNSVSQFFEAEPEAPKVPPNAPKGGLKDDSDAYAMWDALHSSSNSNPSMKEVDLGFAVEPEGDAALAADAAGVPEAAAVAPEPLPDIPIAADTPLGQALLQLARRPSDGSVLDRLTAISDQIPAAVASERVEDAIRALAMVARFEEDAADGTPRNSYRIVLKRLLNRETLVRIAAFTTNPDLADDAGTVLARAGGDATDVLLGLLADSDSIKDRKAYMNALRRVPQGREQIPLMLGHTTWYVARNVAELAGELRLEEAIPELAKLVGHQDQRVRRAAAIALAKIGTPEASEPLRIALKDGAPELRSVIASTIGVAHAVSFTAPLMVLLEKEEDPDTIKELCGALARIGTPEAVQALERAAKQSTLFSRRGKVVKECAETALKRVKR